MSATPSVNSAGTIPCVASTYRRSLRIRIMRLVAVGNEQRVFRLEPQLDRADLPVPMLRDDELGDIRLDRRLFVVIHIAVQKRDDIGFLFDSARISEV